MVEKFEEVEVNHEIVGRPTLDTICGTVVEQSEIRRLHNHHKTLWEPGLPAPIGNRPPQPPPDSLRNTSIDFVGDLFCNSVDLALRRTTIN